MEWCRACGGRLAAGDDRCPWCRVPVAPGRTVPDRLPDPDPFSLDDDDRATELERDDGPAFARARSRATEPRSRVDDRRFDEVGGRNGARTPPAAPARSAEPGSFTYERVAVAEEWRLDDADASPQPRATAPAARFLPRAVAFAIDLVVLTFMNGAVLLAAMLAVAVTGSAGGGSATDPAKLVEGLFTAGQIGLVLGYFGLLHARSGQTVGKALLGLEVTSLDGSRLGLRRGILRAAALLFSALPLGAGFFIAALPPKRALHDYLVGSRVVRTGASR